MTAVKVPQHIAIIMDGNGRWAKQHHLPRSAGHKSGLTAARNVIKHAAEAGIKVVTLFTFSSENWRRPEDEVSIIMSLFLNALQREVKQLHENNIRLKVIGDLTGFNDKLATSILQAQELTANNTGMTVVLAANYGGRWDILNATKNIAQAVQAGDLNPESIDEQLFANNLSTADLPDPDLFIRTSGEMRISNFLLWQLSYAELYFTDCYWPDFDKQQFQQALDYFANRQRRFGYTSDQIEAEQCSSNA